MHKATLHTDIKLSCITPFRCPFGGVRSLPSGQLALTVGPTQRDFGQPHPQFASVSLLGH